MVVNGTVALAHILNSISNVMARVVRLGALLALAFVGSVMPAAALKLSPDSEKMLETAERKFARRRFPIRLRYVLQSGR